MTAIIELMLGIIFIGTEFMPWQEQYQLWTCLLIIIFWIIEVYGTVQAKEKYTQGSGIFWLHDVNLSYSTIQKFTITLS